MPNFHLAILVKSINFVVLGKQDIASDFGKKGTVTDLSIYDRKESDVIKTWVTPSGFPDKIQPLFQAINLAEYVLFHVDKLDKFTGEQIIALDSLKKEKGILSHTFEVDDSKLDAMIKGTVDVKTEIELDFQKNPFYKSEIAENQGCLVNIGLQIKAAKFSSISPLKLTFEKPIVCKKDQIAVILKPESTSIRILGSGKIK